MAGPLYKRDNALAYAQKQGYSEQEFNDWHAKNMGAIAGNEGSGGDEARVQAAFEKAKTPAIAGLEKAVAPPPTPAQSPEPAPTPMPTAAPPEPVAPPPSGGGGVVSSTPATAGLGTSASPMMMGTPDVGGEVSLPGIGALRQLGQRNPPANSMALAGLKRVY